MVLVYLKKCEKASIFIIFYVFCFTLFFSIIFVVFHIFQNQTKLLFYNPELLSVPVPFCINPVQRKEYDRQYIRPYRIVRPGRINLTACYIFDIIFITHIVILCCSVVHRRIMYNNTGITRCSNSAPT